MILCGTLAALSLKRAVAFITPWRSKLNHYGDLAKLVLYPVSGMRATELVSFETLSVFDPAAVVAAFGHAETAARLAATEIVSLRYRTEDAADAQLHRARQEYSETRCALLESYCSENSLPLEQFLAPPPPIEAGSLSYCPTCRAQYRIRTGHCTDCPDIELQALIQ
jgi:hypothetical protein